MPGLSHIEHLSCGPISVVRLERQRPSELHASNDLSQWLSIAEKTRCQKLVIDCSNIEFMSSDMLSRLVMLQRKMREHGGQLVLCGLCKVVRDLFAWTKLDRYFEIQPGAAS
jgi:anti-anti-sigma factor